MILIAQNGIRTIVAPWWNQIRVEPNKGLEVYLEVKNTSQQLRLAKFRSKKKAQALFKAVLEANNNDVRLFSVDKWEKEFDLESSKKASEPAQES